MAWRWLVFLLLGGAVVGQSLPTGLLASLRGSTPLADADVALAGRLLDDPDPLVAQAVLRALQDRAGLVTAPGAERQRDATEAALLLLASPAAGRSPRARAEALHLLAMVASGDGAARQVADWLKDPDPVVADAAEFALARMPAAAVRNAVRPLLESKDGSTERAARLLAASGDRRGAAELKAALAAGGPGALAPWLQYLHAQAAVDADGRAMAVAELRALLAAAEPATRLAAASGLVQLGPDALDDDLLGALADPDPKVQRFAASALAARTRQRPELAIRLRGVLVNAAERPRAGLLRALHEVDPGSILPQLLLAAEGDAPVARTTALELLGTSDQPLAVATLRRNAGQSGAAWQRTALAALLAVAARSARSGNRALARDLCHEVLRHGAAVDLRAAALDELRGVADESSLAELRPVAAVPALSENVAQVQLAIARRMPADRKEAALAILRGAHDLATGAGLRRQIVTQMGKLGEDIGPYAARSGFVQQWKILGPCGRSDGKALGEQPFGADGPDPGKPVAAEGRQLHWQAHRTKDPCGVVDLTFLDPKQDVSAYALLDLEWPLDQAVTLKAGSDDGIAIWVNGERVHHNPAARGVEVDEDTVACRFRKGNNRILLKIAQGGGGWGFCLRIADEQGVPVDLTAVRPP